MTRLSIRHETRYLYGQPVAFGPHRLLVRPRDSHATRLVDASLSLYPKGDSHWVYDAYGNCLCWYQPHGWSDELKIVSTLTLDRFPAPLERSQFVYPQTAMPIAYNLSDRIVLAPFMAPVTDTDPMLTDWVHSHMGGADEPALDFLKRLTLGIKQQFAYVERAEPGVYAPSDLIRWGNGSCRDFAWLMIEALRRLGYAARFVTGYLYSPALEGGDDFHRGACATHAWCEVFLPDVGWVEFDPTNGLVESSDLIQIASTRTPEEAAPITGAIQGDPLSCQMMVQVEVSRGEALLSAVA